MKEAMTRFREDESQDAGATGHSVNQFHMQRTGNSRNGTQAVQILSTSARLGGCSFGKQRSYTSTEGNAVA
jgi:hypothetical protein